MNNYNRGDLVSKKLRDTARCLIDRKLKGEQRLEALTFIRDTRRRVGDLENLMARLEQLPNVERDTASPYSRISDAKVAQLRVDHAAGMSIRDLVAKYGMSRSQTQRICHGESRTGRVTGGPR